MSRKHEHVTQTQTCHANTNMSRKHKYFSQTNQFWKHSSNPLTYFHYIKKFLYMYINTHIYIYKIIRNCAHLYIFWPASSTGRHNHILILTNVHPSRVLKRISFSAIKQINLSLILPHCCTITVNRHIDIGNCYWVFQNINNIQMQFVFTHSPS